MKFRPVFAQWFRFLSSLILFTSTLHADELPLSRIAFGSCCKQDKPQPIWESIVETKPNLFLFIGDNIYGDSEDMQVLRTKWNMLLAQPAYQQLKKTCPILATWDDHDFGVNDGGTEYPKKKESQQLFLDVFDEPQDSPRRKQEGVYDARVFGRQGQRVQIILLDTRYFRSPLRKLKKDEQTYEPGEGYRGPYGPDNDPAATILGEKQWSWLAEQLKTPAEVRIIASSIQVIAAEHGWEKWGNFPRERERLFKLIRDSKAKGVVIISGDRHLAEIAKLDPGIGYPLYDVTSSSLNQPSGNYTVTGDHWQNEINPYRVGLTYFEQNFGTIDIDWKEYDPVLRLQVRDEKGNVVLQQRVKLSQLSGA